jgi:conjugal transfer/entry exclusion protein
LTPIPTFTVLAAIGADLVESAYPLTGHDLDWENLSRWQANRTSLEELLHLRSGAVENLRASVSILAPAATSVITVLLGTK